MGSLNVRSDAVITGTMSRLAGPLCDSPPSPTRALELPRKASSSWKQGPGGLTCLVEALAGCSPFLKSEQTSGRGLESGARAVCLCCHRPHAWPCLGTCCGPWPFPSEGPAGDTQGNPRLPSVAPSCAHTQKSLTSNLSTLLLRGPLWGVGYPKASVCHVPTPSLHSLTPHQPPPCWPPPSPPARGSRPPPVLDPRAFFSFEDAARRLWESVLCPWLLHCASVAPASDPPPPRCS